MIQNIQIHISNSHTCFHFHYVNHNYIQVKRKCTHEKKAFFLVQHSNIKVKHTTEEELNAPLFTLEIHNA